MSLVPSLVASPTRRRTVRTLGVLAATAALSFSAFTTADAAAGFGSGVTTTGNTGIVAPSQLPRSSSVMHATAPGSSIRSIPSAWVSCSGALVAKLVVADAKKKPVAELDVYYRTARGGTIIACYQHKGVLRGVRTPTAVSVVGCTDRTCKKVGAVTVAKGNFRSWAGPAAVAGVAKACIVARGEVQIGKMIAYAQTPVLCG